MATFDPTDTQQSTVLAPDYAKDLEDNVVRWWRDCVESGDGQGTEIRADDFNILLANLRYAGKMCNVAENVDDRTFLYRLIKCVAEHSIAVYTENPPPNPGGGDPDTPPTPFPFHTVFPFTGDIQYWQIPATTKWIKLGGWGGATYRAGGFGSAIFDVRAGSPGPIHAGDWIAIVVGEQGRLLHIQNGPTGQIIEGGYGFAGSGRYGINEGYSGAGMLGFFKDQADVVQTDQGRTLLAVGGAGGSYENDLNPGSDPEGTVGNDPNGGGQPTMRGIDGVSNGDPGGGGGYEGGGSHTPSAGSDGGLGGKGFIHGDAYASDRLMLHVNPVDQRFTNPPQHTHVLWDGNAGRGQVATPTSRGHARGFIYYD